jgi:hypothetical protein
MVLEAVRRRGSLIEVTAAGLPKIRFLRVAKLIVPGALPIHLLTRLRAR